MTVDCKELAVHLLPHGTSEVGDVVYGRVSIQLLGSFSWCKSNSGASM